MAVGRKWALGSFSTEPSGLNTNYHQPATACFAELRVGVAALARDGGLDGPAAHQPVDGPPHKRETMVASSASWEPCQRQRPLGTTRAPARHTSGRQMATACSSGRARVAGTPRWRTQTGDRRAGRAPPPQAMRKASSQAGPTVSHSVTYKFVLTQ